MKLKFFALVAVVTLTLFFFFSSEVNESNSIVSELTQEELNKQYPGEYFYNQRAYPNNYINEEAIKKAEIQAKKCNTL